MPIAIFDRRLTRKAAAITGSGQSVQTTTNLPASTSFSVQGWAHYVAARGNWAYLCQLESSGGSNYIQLGWTDTNGFEVGVQGVGGNAFSSGPAVGTTFAWALTCSGTGAGTAVGYWRPLGSNVWITQSQFGSSFTPSALVIANNAFAEWANVRVWAIKCWDRALSAQELLAESLAADRVAFPASLNFHWPLDGHRDNRDLSGKGRRPTISASPAQVQRAWLLQGSGPPVHFVWLAGGGDATANGVTLTATASLVAGGVGGGVGGTTQTATASLITAGAGGGAGGSTLAATASLIATGAGGGAGGATLAATSSLLPGTATGDATASGATLTATASLIAGSASAGTNGDAAGVTLTATTALVAGTASGDASAAGTTLTPTVSLVAGAAGGGAGGQTLAVASSLVAGSATGQQNPTAAGATLTATASLIAGSASGSGSAVASGATVVATVSMIAGSATGDGTAQGGIFTAVASLLAGAASGQIHVTAAGVTIIVQAQFIAGAAFTEALQVTPGYTADLGGAANRVALSDGTARIATRRSA